MKDFTNQLKELPHKPGVYLMFNVDNEVIYVGKAIDLFRRVHSYFTPSQRGKSPKVVAMVEKVDRFEYIVVENEVEALVLESNFIKEHDPYYNILLRDDKQYPYIHIPKETFPRILKVRQVGEDGGDYFGPFPNAYAVNDIIRLLQRIFKIRTCRLDFDAGQRLKRPCLNYFIDQCPAPCVDKADEGKYMAAMDEVRNFLKGKDGEIRAYLQSEMQSAAEELNFERAARFRDDLFHLDDLQERQKVTFTRRKDADVVAFARGVHHITIQVFFVRDGKLVDREHFEMKEAFQEEGGEIISSFLKQFYLQATYIPSQVLVGTLPVDQRAIEEFLSDRRGARVSILVPQRGDKRALVEMAQKNAEEELVKLERRTHRKNRSKDRGIKQLEDLLGLEGLDRVEAYDISNISGVQNVGSMVVFRREKKDPKEYRKFKIKTVEGPDEYASQREMVSRRFDHGLKDRAEGRSQQTGFGAFPDLILMDGGLGQVHLVEEILKGRDLSIPVVGMVKDDKHVTRALIYQEKEYSLDLSSSLYKYLYAVQEEVHRFAINYHRKLRSKDMVKSVLDEIPGIGPVRRQALLREFGSVEKIKKASLESLTKIKGMDRQSGQNVYAYFHPVKGEKEEG